MNRILTIVLLCLAALAFASCEGNLTPRNDNTEAVDMGLSVKWANCNVGALQPEEAGFYYAWGETETKKDYSWDAYIFCNADGTDVTRYYTATDRIPDNAFVDLAPDDDISYRLMGGKWRTATKAEWEELCNPDNCTWTWKEVNGKAGYEVKSKITGSTIFLPAAGYRDDRDLKGVGDYGGYWASTVDPANYFSAGRLYFAANKLYTDTYSRFRGRSVRPVLDDGDWSSITAALTTNEATDVKATTATVSGTLTYAGANPNVRVMCYYSSTETDADGLKANGTRAFTLPDADGKYSFSLVNLEKSTTYRFVVVGAVRDAVFTGDMKSFTTAAK